MDAAGGPSEGVPSPMWLFRYKNRLMQKDVAEYLGVTKVYISRVETGDSVLSEKKIAMLIDNDRGWDASMFAEGGGTEGGNPAPRPAPRTGGDGIGKAAPPSTCASAPDENPRPLRMPLSESERLEFLIRTLEGGVAARFSEKTGIHPSKLSRVKGGELHLYRLAGDILRAYPSVSREWLDTGTGYPGDLSIDLVRSRLMRTVEDRDRVILALTAELETQRRIIDKFLARPEEKERPNK